MAWASKTFTFSPSTVIRSSEVNDNFDDMVDQLNVAMPTYGAIFWTQSIASIPAGWYICDGANGTPDLIDKFIVCAGGTYAVHDEGGEAEHVLTIAELPTIDLDSYKTDPGHHHLIYGSIFQEAGSGTNHRELTNSGSGSDNVDSQSVTTGITFAPFGSDDPHNNMPPFHALPIIMKS